MATARKVDAVGKSAPARRANGRRARAPRLPSGPKSDKIDPRQVRLAASVRGYLRQVDGPHLRTRHDGIVRKLMELARDVGAWRVSALGASAANQRLGHVPVGADKGSPPLLAAVENLLEVGRVDWLVGGLRRDPCEVEPDTRKRELNSDRQCAAAWWPIEWSSERVLVTTMQAGGIADGAIARAVAGESGNEGRVTSARGNARRLARGVASAFLRRLANDTDDDTEARAHRERALAIEAGDAPPTQNRRVGVLTARDVPGLRARAAALRARATRRRPITEGPPSAHIEPFVATTLAELDEREARDLDELADGVERTGEPGRAWHHHVEVLCVLPHAILEMIDRAAVRAIAAMKSEAIDTTGIWRRLVPSPPDLTFAPPRT